MMFDVLICEWRRANTLTNDKTLDQLKLKAFADNKLEVIQMAKFILDKAENIAVQEVTIISFFDYYVFKWLFHHVR